MNFIRRGVILDQVISGSSDPPWCRPVRMFAICFCTSDVGISFCCISFVSDCFLTESVCSSSVCESDESLAALAFWGCGVLPEVGPRPSSLRIASGYLRFASGFVVWESFWRPELESRGMPHFSSKLYIAKSRKDGLFFKPNPS